MINLALNFQMGNFFVKQHSFHNLANKTFSVTENKTIELECYRQTQMLFEFDFFWHSKADHPGLNMTVFLFCHALSFNFYDNRHWNNKENRWCKPGESIKKFEDDLL